MPVGDWTLFRKGSLKFSQGLIDLDTHAFKVALTTSAQALSNTFVGSSTDCRYADLTAELSTASGYTSGGGTLSGVSVNQSTTIITWSATNQSWTLSGSLVFKYAVIYDDTNANKDLLCFSDIDTGGGSVTASMSPLVFTLSSGILKLTTS